MDAIVDTHQLKQRGSIGTSMATLGARRCSVLALAACLCLLVSLPAGAADPFTVRFATVSEGQAVLTTVDDFVSRLSPFDRAARLQTDQPVSREKYLDFVAGEVRAWTDEEKQLIADAWNALRPAIARWDLPWPKEVLFIKTSGQEEGGAQYTRGSAVILNQALLQEPDPAVLRQIIAHELFHVLSRNSPVLRKRLYALIGFQPCGEQALPPALVERRITNPDAPGSDVCIRVEEGGSSTRVVPVLYAKRPTYDPSTKQPFFAYLEFRLMRVSADGAERTEADLLKPDAVSGFFEQVGRNTNYIVHPEEILADNFKMLVTGAGKVRSPELLDKLSAALQQQ